ncbi:hypothetical protein DZF91_36085 [Actinomadura logoneensis]|uniref:WD40 repeat domain-containing protein n=1 Tax=Actinomadura logoneensis TaxID=2293572 RepID=A0A372JA22_9ACTN|nr:hypothetical protein DZF91_36085 [Actinomadura logoneensis]
MVIAAAGVSLGIEFRRGADRPRAAVSASRQPTVSGSPQPTAPGSPHAGAPLPGRRPAPGPVVVQGRQVGQIVSDPPGPLTLTSFSLPAERDLSNVTAYVLDASTGTFAATPYVEAAVSPDGRTVAGVPRPDETSRRVAVRDRRTGAERRVSLPASTGHLRWSPRGRRILVSLYSGAINEGLRGFAVIDADTLRVRVTWVGGAGRPERVQPEAQFAWDATGRYAVAPGAGSRLLRFPASGGRPEPDVRLTEFHDTRELLYSPSGRMLACDYLHGMGNAIVLWDTSGRTTRELRRLRDLTLLGWYDETHLLAVRIIYPDRMETVLVDLDGKVRQLLVKDGAPWPGPGSMGRYSAVPRS